MLKMKYIWLSIYMFIIWQVISILIPNVFVKIIAAFVVGCSIGGFCCTSYYVEKGNK